MPELPEVETVCRGIEPFVCGETVTNIQLNRPNLRFPFPELFEERVCNLKVHSIKRRAKYILMHLTDDKIIVIHLGMSGQIKIISNYKEYELVKHDHMILHFGADKALVYNDPRRFGFVKLFEDMRELDSDSSFCNIGPDPYDKSFGPDALYKRLQKKSAPIKSALLDQSLIAGLGNIYVCEALFLSHISPMRPASDVSRKEAEKLYGFILTVLDKAIEAGGSTLKDYRHADGKLGYFQHYFKVYGRESEPCVNYCGSVIQRKVQSGRSSFYCPTCQK